VDIPQISFTFTLSLAAASQHTVEV